jgi:hypothetical protein
MPRLYYKSSLPNHLQTLILFSAASSHGAYARNPQPGQPANGWEALYPPRAMKDRRARANWFKILPSGTPRFGDFMAETRIVNWNHLAGNLPKCHRLRG